ncbi:MAG: hypothetical protein GEU71_14620 [Actinobacteria bacterium]|nr:hypothetical protein [Actinomycetota bacterium]
MSKRRSPESMIDRVTKMAASCPETGFECFHGYGVMGLTFASGHVLALRHWTRSSIGPGYTSVWHRDPQEEWSFWSTQSPETSCNRYTGESACETRQTPIAVTWSSEDRLRVVAPDVGLDWAVAIGSTLMTRVMGVVLRRLPRSVRTHPVFLKTMGPIGGRALGIGSFNMTGKMPNRQTFVAAPSAMWVVRQSSARIGDIDLGPVGPLPRQAALLDFLIPQRGIVAAGSAYFEELDPDRHSTILVRRA